MEPHMSTKNEYKHKKFTDKDGNTISFTQYMVGISASESNDLLFGSAPAPETQMNYEYPIRTQKARGIRMLSEVAQLLGAESMMPLPSKIVPARILAEKNDENLQAFYGYLQSRMHHHGSGYFMRPCPMRPRHGFVDSRRIPDAEAIREIAKETIKADPDGEIAFHAFIDAGINAVLTANSVVLGPGHDGATAGKQSIAIPIATPKLKWSLKILDLGVGEHESPYLEFVESTNAAFRLPFLTQVRAGPEVQCADDYVPFRVKVSQVIPVDGDMDLLEWEAQAQSLKQVKGVVVHHPGGSISSHFGVHCVINEIPYITTHEPKVGDLITNTSETAWDDSDYEYLGKLVRQYDALKPPMAPPPDSVGEWESFSGIARFVIAALHGTGSLMQSRSEYAFRAVAAGLVFASKLFNALTLGELRHAPGSTTRNTPAKILAEHFGLNDDSERSRRPSIYWEALNNTVGRNYHKNVPAYHIYSQPIWAEGYGGSSWAECARISHAFTNSIMAFALAPSADRLKDALNSFNVIITLAHNNGWWLNKVIPQTTFQDLSVRPALGMVNAFAYHALNGVLPEPTPESKYILALEKAKENERECLDVLTNLPAGLMNPDALNAFNFTEEWVKNAEAELAINSDRAVVVPFVFSENGSGDKTLTFPFIKAGNGRPLKLSAFYVFSMNRFTLRELFGGWPLDAVGHLILLSAWEEVLIWFAEPIGPRMKLMRWVEGGVNKPNQCEMDGNRIILSARSEFAWSTSPLKFREWVDNEAVSGTPNALFFFRADLLKKWQNEHPLKKGSMTLAEVLKEYGKEVEPFVPPLLFGGENA